MDGICAVSKISQLTIFDANVKRSDIVSRILSCREAAFGILSNDDSFKNIMKLDLKATRLLGARMDLEGSKTFRLVGSMQESLAVLAHLSNLVEPYQLMGLTIGNAVKKEMANTLWSRDEIIPAIRMLQQLKQVQDLDSQSIPVGRAGLLATLVRTTLTLAENLLILYPRVTIRRKQGSKNLTISSMNTFQLLKRSFTETVEVKRPGMSSTNLHHIVTANCSTRKTCRSFNAAKHSKKGALLKSAS